MKSKIRASIDEALISFLTEQNHLRNILEKTMGCDEAAIVGQDGATGPGELFKMPVAI